MATFVEVLKIFSTKLLNFPFMRNLTELLSRGGIEIQISFDRLVSEIGPVFGELFIN